MHLYVYYDVPHAEVRTLIDRVRSMQRELVDRAPTGRLMRRADAAADRETWMEVYEDVPAGFEARLAEAADRLGIASRTGPRHVERFVEIVPCA